LPTYVIEPPDVLLIDAVRVVPLPPYHIEPLDILAIQVTDTLPGEDIRGLYTVEPEGMVNLGFSYGAVRVVGMTIEEAKVALENHLKTILRAPKVVVSLAQSRGLQQIRGEHLVRPDGTVGLGTYGSVYVAGMSLPDAKAAIEEHLKQFLAKPEITLDVFAYNSKVFYVIFDGAGFGQQITRLPVTGNETVLDAISQLSGLPATSSKRRIWVARPAPADADFHQVLPVNWNAIVRGGDTSTNYQLLPGDRLYVSSDRWILFDNALAKFTAPFERMFGFTLLGNSTIRVLQQGSGAFNQGGFGFGGFGGFGF
jgi:polysaccharide export outer membrane protein